MALSQALLEKMEQAAATGGGNYIHHGRYTFLIDKFIIKEDGFKGASVILELFVLESEPASDGKIGPDGPANPLHSRCSVVFNLTGGDSRKVQASHGNLKAAMIGIMGETEYNTAINDARLGDTSAKRYLSLLTLLQENGRGLRVGDETYLSPAQSGPNAGKDMVRHKWQTIATDEKLQAEYATFLAGKGSLPVEGAPAATVAA